MGTVSVTLPSDGQTIDSSDVNTPINAILSEFNGNIDDNNIKTGANINGAKLGAGTLPGSAFDSTIAGGWLTGALPAVSSVTANGNRSYDITFASTVASILSSGMRLRTTRTVAAPTQCTSLNGTTQYYSKTTPNKLTFTDDFVVSAWVKLTSYAAGAIASRYNGTSGWRLSVAATGVIEMVGYNAGAGNFSYLNSYQSVPLNKWVHITAQLDMSTFTASTTTSYAMIDGVDVPILVGRAGTNPTALIQAGNLEIGSWNGGLLPFPGKIAQVAIYSAKVTQATIKASINQGLSGSETSLASAYSFNNAITDLNTTTPNDLTANGSAVATNADSPFGNAGTSSTLDYALVQSVSTTVATVSLPEGCTIPTSGGVTSVAYSVQGNPYGWPGCEVAPQALRASAFSTAGANTQIDGLSITFKSPIPGKKIRITAYLPNVYNSTGATNSDSKIWLGTAGSGTQLGYARNTSGGANYAGPATVTTYYTAPSTTDAVFNVSLSNVGGGTANVGSGGATEPMWLTAEYVAPL